MKPSITIKQEGTLGDYVAVVVTGEHGSSMPIPILETGQPMTDDYIMALDKAIKTDGCTGIKDFYRECCVVHDLGYRYEIDPWGHQVDREITDRNLRECVQSRSKLGRFSPVSWVRWAGVRTFGRYFYKPKV